MPISIVYKRKNIDKSTSQSNYIENTKKLLKNRYASRFLMYNAIIGFGAGLVVPYFNVYLKYKVNAGTDTIGVIMAFAQAAMGFGGLVTPFMAKKLGRVKTINICQILSIPFLLLIALPPNIYIVSAALFVRNGLMNMAGPVVSTLTMELIDSSQRSTFASINNIANNLSRAISTMLGGFIMANVPYGYEVPYFLTAMLYLAATLLFHKTFAGYEVQFAGSKRVRSIF
ncbi:MFS transporter [Clostridium polynesiense]|uniref:MFS transporter n=1 Tax=Clostridium polynesiense TaxID=1325933 RepID=UPI00058F66DE|nr:MFS transporter [Clostridium polynesiense]